MVQQTMERMMSNPELMEQMIRQSPLLAGNPQAAELVSSTQILCFSSLFHTCVFLYKCRQEIQLKW